jgi:hypothetical protein
MSSLRQVPDLVDFNQGLAGGQQLSDARPTPNDKVFESRITTIAAGDPDHYRWRSTALQDLDKIVVLGDDHGLYLASLLENLRILGLKKAKILNMSRTALAKVA